MFNRYWREYPWFLQLILFGLMVFVFVSFSLVILHITVPKITGESLADITNISKNSSPAKISTFIWVQAFSSVFMFVIPTLLFAYQTHPAVGSYLGLKKPKFAAQYLWSVLLVMGALPLFLELANLMKQIDFGPGSEAMQSRMEEITETIMTMKTGGELARAIFVMALIPAIGEELFFRGIIMRLLHQQSKKMGLAVIVSAIFFTVVHGAPANFLSIFIAGVLLALIYIYTGSLWCSIATHFIYNGSQIVLNYYGNNNANLKEAVADNHLPIYIVIAGLLVFAGAFYMLWKNRTPLGADWSDNFKEERTIAYEETDHQ